MGHSIFVPIGYVVLVFGSLALFSSWYRKRLANRLTEPYFLSHPDRDIYVTLLGKTNPPTNDALLKSALVRRAMADVQRVLRIREDKPALQNLLQKGSIGDDLWNSLLAAEKEMEAEVMEVVMEANTFAEGWGTVIFQTANEMIANEKMRAVFDATADTRTQKEAKYGQWKEAAVDAQVPSLQTIHSTLNSLPQPTPPTTPNNANGAVVPPTPSTPATPGTPTSASKTPNRKAKKRK